MVGFLFDEEEEGGRSDVDLRFSGLLLFVAFVVEVEVDAFGGMMATAHATQNKKKSQETKFASRQTQTAFSYTVRCRAVVSSRSIGAGLDQKEVRNSKRVRHVGAALELCGTGSWVRRSDSRRRGPILTYRSVLSLSFLRLLPFQCIV